MLAAIAIDEWKLAIFTRHLDESGYEFVNMGKLTSESLILHVRTEDPQRLFEVIQAANTEAAKHAAH